MKNIRYELTAGIATVTFDEPGSPVNTMSLQWQADLNEMVVAQWRKIDALERRLGELREEFDAAALARPDAPEPPPPHY